VGAICKALSENVRNVRKDIRPSIIRLDANFKRIELKIKKNK